MTGTLNVLALVPTVSNTYDIGSGTKLVKDVYIAGNLSDATNTLTVANAKSAYTHVTNNGTDHSYIDQSVISGASPNFTKLVGEKKCWDFTIIDPYNTYGIDTQIFIARSAAALTITKLVVELDATTNDVAGDLKYADDFLTFGTATLINDFDTTSGTRTDTTITSGAVAAGKCVYLQFDSQPHADINQMHVHIEWGYD